MVSNIKSTDERVTETKSLWIICTELSFAGITLIRFKEQIAGNVLYIVV